MNTGRVTEGCTLTIRTMTSEYRVFQSFSSLYYPWANGQAESTNKILVTILYKTYGVEGQDWEEQLPVVIWAYKTTYKAITGHTSFHLMYRQEAIMPIEHTVPRLRVAIQNRLGDEESLKERLHTLLKLDEMRIFSQWAIEVS